MKLNISANQLCLQKWQMQETSARHACSVCLSWYEEQQLFSLLRQVYWLHLALIPTRQEYALYSEDSRIFWNHLHLIFFPHLPWNPISLKRKEYFFFFFGSYNRSEDFASPVDSYCFMVCIWSVPPNISYVLKAWSLLQGVFIVTLGKMGSWGLWLAEWINPLMNS